MKILLCSSLLVALPAVAAPSSQNKDAFQTYFSGRIAHQKKLSESLRDWTQKIRGGDLDAALETAPKEIPASLKNDVVAAKLYLVWRRSLNRTFLDQWLRELQDTGYASSPAEGALEKTVAAELENRLIDSGLTLNANQRAEVERLPSRPIFVTMRAWSGLRDEKRADELLKGLNAGSRLERYLISTAVYAHIRRGDWRKALSVLDASVPKIEANRDLNALVSYDVVKARILYQQKRWADAAKLYVKVPNQSPQFLEAQEELAWVYLQQNDNAKLRGEIAGLTAAAFRDRFQPEVYLLRSISDLRMCFYDRLESDISDFQSGNAAWAKKIDEALASANPPAPAKPDDFTRLSERRVRSLRAEQTELKTLEAGAHSGFWKQALASATVDLGEAQKQRSENFVRQWKNQQSELREAIRKMRFVKVEYVNQLRLADSTTAIPGSKVADNGDGRTALGNESNGSKKNWVFPASSEIWPDEWFHLRSAALARCQKKAGQQ